MNVSATVVRAGLAPLNTLGRGYKDWVCVVTDLGSGPVALWSVVRLDRERWLLPGTPVTVDVNESRIGGTDCFDVDHSTVPPIQDRVAASDPVVCDPRAARRAARQAMAEATEHPPMFRTLFGPGVLDHRPQSGPGVDDDAWNAACDKAIEAMATTQAPAGMVRAVLVLVGMRMLLRDLSRSLIGGQPNPEQRSFRPEGRYREASRGNETVFAVNTAGRSPWAVHIKDFKAPSGFPVGTAPALYPWLPALVPANGTGPVTVVWDEVRQVTDTRTRLLAGDFQVARQMLKNIRAAQAGPDLSVLPPAAFQAAALFAQSLRTLPPPAYRAAIANALASLNTVPPEHRPAYLALWRSHGVPV